jgi:hypothetical protein
LAFIQVVKELAKIVELKSKVAPGRYTVEDLRLRLGYDTGEMRRSDYDPSIIEQHERFNARLEALLLHPVIGTYLRELTPQQPYQAQVSLCTTWMGSKRKSRASHLGLTLYGMDISFSPAMPAATHCASTLLLGASYGPITR